MITSVYENILHRISCVRTLSVLATGGTVLVSRFWQAQAAGGARLLGNVGFARSAEGPVMFIVAVAEWSNGRGF